SAQSEIEKAFQNNRQPILTGGTGLYLEFLMHGRSAMPNVAESFNWQAKSDYETQGGAALLEKLVAVDASAAKLNPGDRARVIRAYSVYLATGRGMGDWQKNFQPPAHAWTYKTIILLPERQQLYRNIDTRFLRMIETGVMEEVKAAMGRGVPADHPAHKAHGARELQNVLEGRWSLEKATARSQQVTRNYAKRQFTWFKNRFVNKEKAAGRPVLMLTDAQNAIDHAKNFMK
ncbi:MAG TPA: tRNA dimethylallyltransferase, partial [Alphaproteobacteria bacterium]|nr:tRNA dimethylallyltransferase [Alphaproteobacteria bacterium]